MVKANETMDLSALGDDKQQSRAMDNLKKNLSQLLISSVEVGPEINFGPAEEGGEDRVLKFKSKVPVTAMEALLSGGNQVHALKTYIALALLPESRELFEELLDLIPLEGLSAIVEVISEATTPFPTK